MIALTLLAKVAKGVRQRRLVVQPTGGDFCIQPAKKTTFGHRIADMSAARTLNLGSVFACFGQQHRIGCGDQLRPCALQRQLRPGIGAVSVRQYLFPGVSCKGLIRRGLRQDAHALAYMCLESFGKAVRVYEQCQLTAALQHGEALHDR